jgi:hypothetical protein
MDCYTDIKVLEKLGVSVFRVDQQEFLDCHKDVSTPLMFT